MSDPTPDEIRRQCEAIRSTWSAAELRKRAAWMIEAEQVEFVRTADPRP